MIIKDLNKMREFNLDDLLINKNLSTKDAMKRLDIVASKILFVVDNENKLVGSLSDGDIRRYILDGGNLDSLVSTSCNKNPFKMNIKSNRNVALLKMLDLDLLLSPIVDENNIVCDILTCSSKPKIINKSPNSIVNIPVVIMAGGKGSRLEPFTSVLPKPLIPIGEKTMVEHIISEYRKYHIVDYYLTINYKANLIEAYFNGIKKDYKINYLREEEFLGTASSLRLLKNVPETFIVSNCDIIVKADYLDVLDFHRKSGSVLTILSSIQHQSIPYGVIKFQNGGRVTNIEEKPEYSMPINTGVYILNKEAWEMIPENKFSHMTHLIELLIKQNKKVMTYPVSENDYIDVGEWDEYKDAIKKLAL